MATEIADAYIALYTRMPGVQNDVKQALGGIDAAGVGDGVGKKFSAGLAGAVGGAMAAVTSKAIGVIASSIDSAIARVDTINNFPKIMQNLGYSSDDAAASIQTMSERLTGLPTVLDSMAGMVQQLAPLTGGLGEATELSLALNNALLAGGKSTDIQANAMEQYTQMLAVGKVDMAAWRSMVSAMPGQMDQLAQSILGAGAKSMDLYEAMKNGAIGFDEFNAAVLKLNSEGTGAFASFEDQARSSTDGIATSQANLQTAIVRGLADVIQEARPLIDGLISGATELAKILFPIATAIVAVVVAVTEWTGANREWLIPLGIFAGTITAVVVGINLARQATLAWAAATKGAQVVTMLSSSGLTIYNGILKAQAIATGIATGAQRLFNAAMSANPIGVIITIIGALVAALIWFFTQTELGKEVWANITQFIGDALTWLWESVLEPVFAWIGEAWNNVAQFFQDAWANVLKPVFDAIGEVFTWIYENIIHPIITGIMIYIGLWAALIQWLWESAIQPAITAIGEFFTWLYETIIVPIIDGIVLYVQMWAAIFTWLWENVISPAISAIGAALQWIWDSIIMPVVNFIVAYIQAWGAIFTWLWENAINPAIQAVAAGFQWVWSAVIMPVVNFISEAITNVGNTIRSVFDGIAGFIGAAFEAVLGVVRGPINALIDLINGVIGGLNSVSVQIPDWVPEVGGQTFGLSIPSIPKLAAGALVSARPGGIIANIGEGRYDEAVVPLSPAVLSQLGGGRGDGPLVSVTPGPGMDEREIARIAANEIAWAMRGA